MTTDHPDTAPAVPLPGAQHAAAAGERLASADDAAIDDAGDEARTLAAIAQVHATLALHEALLAVLDELRRPPILNISTTVEDDDLAERIQRQFGVRGAARL